MSQYEAVDIPNPKCYAHPEKFDELYIRLRKEDPLPWVEAEEYRPFWAVTKFSDITEIEAKPQIFLSEPQAILNPKVLEDERMKQFGRMNSTRTLNQMDPPDHTKYRNLTQAWFSPENLLKLKQAVIDIAKEHIQIMYKANGKCDFVSQVAKLYSLRVIMKILGLPPKDEEFMLKLTQQFFTPHDPKSVEGKNEKDIRTASVKEMNDYFKNIIEDRKANPQNDLSTIIANAKIDGKPIPELEQLSYFILISTAGHDTTSTTIAEAMLLFAQQPKIFKELKSNLSLLPSAVEEMFRWAVPVKTFMRTAAEDYELRGKKIKAGERVLLCYQSGCRDEEIIDDPFTFRINRKPNRHLAFGYGPHVCLGQHLARLELMSFFEELIPRLESVEVDGEYTYVQGTAVSGLRNLPLKFKMQ